MRTAVGTPDDGPRDDGHRQMMTALNAILGELKKMNEREESDRREAAREFLRKRRRADSELSDQRLKATVRAYGPERAREIYLRKIEKDLGGEPEGKTA